MSLPENYGFTRNKSAHEAIDDIADALDFLNGHAAIAEGESDWTTGLRTKGGFLILSYACIDELRRISDDLANPQLKIVAAE